MRFMSAQSKSQRIEARITPDGLAMVRRAAEIEGRSISDFVLQSIQEKARQVIDDTEVVRLAMEDQRVFLEALLNPPEPNEALKRAERRYREMTGGK